MRRYLLILLCLWLVQPAWALTPIEAATEALKDLKSLPVEVQQRAVYYWAGCVDKGELERFWKVFVFHLNSISRETDLKAPVQVAADLWRVDLRDYGWKKEAYNKLAQVDPYFHVKVKVVLAPVVVAPVIPAVPAVPAVSVISKGDTIITTRACKAFTFANPKQVRGGLDKGQDFEVLDTSSDSVLIDTTVGKLWVRLGDVAKVEPDPESASPPEPLVLAPKIIPETIPLAEASSKESIASAPWLPAKVMAEMILLTQNEAPLLRADWFFTQTARQVDLNNKQVVGYYDFLGIKKEDDLEVLAGIDRKVIARRRQEMRAIITDSGVTLHNRQIASLDDGSRGYWESLDVENNQDNANAARQLDGDYKPVAKEVYFRLPNGLWGLAAVNAQNGNLAPSVPDSIASDLKSTSNDHRIHPGLSCIRCHVEGLRPLDDWARRFYAKPPGDVKLVSVDYEKLRRLQRLYLGPLQDRYEDDQRYYARVVMRLLAWTPQETAKRYAASWQAYADLPITGKQLAQELGVEYDFMVKALKWYVKPALMGGGGSQDPILIGFLKVPEFTARREYIEEAYVLFQQAVAGYKPEPEK